MATRTASPTTARGLTTEQLTSIRDSLAAGRKPKVTFTDSAGQIAGQSGQVVQLTDPDASDEWVVVRFGRDELPFSPVDLAVPGRAPRGSAVKVPVEPPPPAPEFKITRQSVPAPREKETTMPRASEKSADKIADKPAEKAAEKAADRTKAPVVPEQPSPNGVEAAAGVDPVKPARKPTRPARPKGPAGLTVTLAYAEGEWTLAAQQGSKALAKPYVVRPAEALKIVAMVDVPGVHEAVDQIMSVERAEAEHQAEKLRAELAEIEARLAELRDVG
jgi:hypothetical protein